MIAGQIAGHSAGHLESSDYAAVRADVAAGILRTREDVYPRVPAEGYRHSDNIQVRVVFAIKTLNFGPLTFGCVSEAQGVLTPRAPVSCDQCQPSTDHPGSDYPALIMAK